MSKFELKNRIQARILKYLSPEQQIFWVIENAKIFADKFSSKYGEI